MSGRGRDKMRTAPWKRAQGPARSVDGPGRVVGCTNREGQAKTRFYTRTKAKSVAKSAGQRIGHRLKEYLCPNCAGYHLTHDYRPL